MDKIYCGNGIGDLWAKRCSPETLGVYLDESATTPDFNVPIPREFQGFFATSSGRRGAKRDYVVPTSQLVRIPKMQAAIEKALYQK